MQGGFLQQRCEPGGLGRADAEGPGGLQAHGVNAWITESQGGRITGWAGRDLKEHLDPTHCHRQGLLALEQVAQSLIQPQTLPGMG